MFHILANAPPYGWVWISTTMPTNTNTTVVRPKYAVRIAKSRHGLIMSHAPLLFRVVALPDTPQVIWQLAESLPFEVIELPLNDKGAAVHRSSGTPSVRKIFAVLYCKHMNTNQSV